MLEWQNLIFYIPVAFGLLMGLGSAFGLGDGHGHDFDGAAGHDAGHEAGHGHDGGKDAGKSVQKGANPLDLPPADAHGFHPIGSFLDLLGVGRVPLTLVLMMSALLFGGVGMICNTLIAGAGLDTAHFFWVSIPVAFVAMVSFTGILARGINRVMPTSESYNVTKHDLVGQTGTLVLPTDAARGLAQVRDRQGNVFNVACRTDGAALPGGQEILVIDYVSDKDEFLVEAYSTNDKNDAA